MKGKTTWIRIVYLVLLSASVSTIPSRIIAQRRTSTSPNSPTRAIDYSKFSHASKQHQAATCKSCHTAPTQNWQKARGFPDVADYPGHDACVRCHRSQFFRGQQPPICSVCHSKVSPREDVRFAFRNPVRPRQFTIEFPHDKHQDVIASWRATPSPGRVQFAKISFVATDQTPQEAKKSYNNCTICHATNTRAVLAPTVGWIDQFTPKADSFKTSPDAHSACFNCHWKNQKPVRDDCAGCHKPHEPFEPSAVPIRKSMKFTHAREQHIAECTTCHINITESVTLRGLKPDVPITGCTECHNKDGLRLDLSKELVTIDKDKAFVCVYCHTSDVGRRDAPPSHYVVAERPPLKRQDLK